MIIQVAFVDTICYQLLLLALQGGTAFAESKDGVHWRKPNRMLVRNLTVSSVSMRAVFLHAM